MSNVSSMSYDYEDRIDYYYKTIMVTNNVIVQSNTYLYS